MVYSGVMVYSDVTVPRTPLSMNDLHILVHTMTAGAKQQVHCSRWLGCRRVSRGLASWAGGFCPCRLISHHHQPQDTGKHS